MGTSVNFFEISERGTFLFSSENYVSIIACDFHIYMGTNSLMQEQMLLTLDSTGFQNVTNSPTPIAASCACILDAIITNINNSFLFGRTAAVISDHLSVVLRIEQTIRSYDISKMSRQLISQGRLDLFENHISLVDWSPIYNEAAASDALTGS